MIRFSQKVPRVLSFIAVVFAAFLASETARAQFTLNDPDQVFADLKTFSRAPLATFEKAMGCDTSLEFVANHSRCTYRCTSMFCSSQCEIAVGFEARYPISVAECTADTAHIFGDNGLKLEISRADFERDGTWIPALLKGLGLWVQPVGELKILNHWSGRVSRIVGGRKEAIPYAREVHVELRFSNTTQHQTFIVLLDMEKSGLAQFLGIVEGIVPGPNSMTFAMQRGVILESSSMGGFFR